MLPTFCYSVLESIGTDRHPPEAQVGPNAYLHHPPYPPTYPTSSFCERYQSTMAVRKLLAAKANPGKRGCVIFTTRRCVPVLLTGKCRAPPSFVHRSYLKHMFSLRIKMNQGHCYRLKSPSKEASVWSYHQTRNQTALLFVSVLSSWYFFVSSSSRANLFLPFVSFASIACLLCPCLVVVLSGSCILLWFPSFCFVSFLLLSLFYFRFHFPFSLSRLFFSSPLCLNRV